MPQRNTVTRLLALLLLLGCAARAATQEAEHPYLERRHLFIAGGYWQEADASIRETREPLPRVTLDLDDLGVDDRDATGYLEYRYKFTDRWSMVAAGQRFTDSGEVGLSREINFAGVPFEAGLSLKTRVRIDTYFADVMYRFYQSPRAEVSAGGGLHIFNFEASLYGGKFITNRFVDRQRELITSSSDVIAPLPNLRVQAFYAFNDRWSIMGNAGWMSANVDEWDGRFIYYHARTHLRITERFGVAVGYQVTDVDVERDRRRKSSEYDIEFSGPSLVFTFAL